MAKRHDRSLRKPSGGMTRRHRKPRKQEQGGAFTASTVGEDQNKDSRSNGGNRKTRVKRSLTVNLSVDGETRETEIQSVVENPANPDYVRRDLLTKGAVIQTEEGKARITSRPGQEGTVNAVPLEE